MIKQIPPKIPDRSNVHRRGKRTSNKVLKNGSKTRERKPQDNSNWGEVEAVDYQPMEQTPPKKLQKQEQLLELLQVGKAKILSRNN